MAQSTHEATKPCTKCEQAKPLTEFYRRGKGYFGPCKVCVLADRRERYEADGETLRERVRAYQAANPEKVREAARRRDRKMSKDERRRANLWKNFRITPEQWDAMFAGQGGRCAVCLTDDPGRYWCTDHDHATGAVRGILCWHCNVGLGHFRDDPEVLAAAINYLTRTEAHHGSTEGAPAGGEAGREAAGAQAA